MERRCHWRRLSGFPANRFHEAQREVLLQARARMPVSLITHDDKGEQETADVYPENLHSVIHASALFGCFSYFTETLISYHHRYIK